MADGSPKDVLLSEEGEEASQLNPTSNQATAPQEEPPVRPLASPLHRAGTLPTQPRRNLSTVQQANNRPRGRTVSAKSQNLAPRELSPRSQLLKRSPMRPEGNDAGQALDSIPERHVSAAGRPRGSTNSEREQRFSFSSPVQGLRGRTGTWATVSPRGLQRRPTVLLEAPQAMATGRDLDNQSVNFTLAGPAPIETVAANQPYVDPGYSELNPAYDQPVNSRPVWGLAKPLPRVIRPGMVPSRSELKIQIPEAEQRRAEAPADLEQGRIEPTLNLGRVSSQLQNARQERENRLFQGLQRTGTNLSLVPTLVSPLARRQTSNLGSVEPFSPPGESAEDLGTAKTRPSDLAPVPEQAIYDDRPAPEEAEPFPSDVESVMTEKVGEEDLDGNWIGEELPLKAYDPETDEIHNLHTHWSIIRLRFREPLAELLAVTVQLTLGFCADLVVVTSSSAAGNEATTDWHGASTSQVVYLVHI
jgi:aquaglyceroporin related protein